MKTRFNFTMGATKFTLPKVTPQAPNTCGTEFVGQIIQPIQAVSTVETVVDIPEIHIEGEVEYTPSELKEIWGLTKDIKIGRAHV